MNGCAYALPLFCAFAAHARLVDANGNLIATMQYGAGSPSPNTQQGKRE